MKIKLLLILTVLLLLAAVPLIWLFYLPEAPFQFLPEPEPDLPQIAPPPGTQLLLFPMEHGVITAGYRNATYNAKNGYPHYGTDITSHDGGYAKILASGDGVVLGVEFCDNSLGNITVIRYDNVYLPQSSKTLSLIARYYHMTSLLVEAGDTVTAGQAIGDIDGRHQWYHHIHIELDTDIKHPFHTPQVAEATSELLVRFPANGDDTIDPISVLAVGIGQRIFVHPHSDCCTEKDAPQFMEVRG